MFKLRFSIVMAGWLTVLFVAASVHAQKPASKCDGWKRVPSKLVAFLYLDQKELNIELGSGQMLFSPDNKVVLTVKLRNGYGKSIRSVELVQWHLGGGSDEWFQRSTPANNQNQEFRIGATLCDSAPELSNAELESSRLPNDLLITAVVFGIRKIWFEDGTQVEDSDVTRRFDEFAQRIHLENKE